MSLRFTYYKDIKDKYCINYPGHCLEYIIQLRELRPYLSKKYPELQLFIAGRGEAMQFLTGYDNVLCSNDLPAKRREFGYVREIATNLSGNHPIMSFAQESGINVPNLNKSRINSESKLCIVCPEGVLPTKPMTKDQINQEIQLAIDRGYYTEIFDGDYNKLNEAGFVIGVECAGLFEAACRGIKTKLIPTGIGTKLFNLMFPTSVPNRIYK